MKYIIIAAFIAVYIFGGKELGYSSYSAWWTHFTYALQHGSLLHLAINCFSFFMFYSAIEKHISPYVFLPVGYFISVIGSYMLYYNIIVVGSSALVYALVGIYSGLIISKKMSVNAFWFFVSLLIFLIISFFKSNSAGMLHFVCLVLGLAFYFIYEKCL